MKNVVMLVLLSITLASCGLKRPLTLEDDNKGSHQLRLRK